MAMTKNIRTTVNTISKLFSITHETHRRMQAVQTAKTIKDSLEASKALNNFSKRVDRLCVKLGFDREIVDEIFLRSEGCEDIFVLHLLSIYDYAFSAYSACVNDGDMDEEDTEEGTTIVAPYAETGIDE